MLMELCKETGWTIEYVLSMKAIRFFALRRALFSILSDEKMTDLIQRCDIQAISIGDVNYYKELREHYRGQVSGAKKKLPLRTFDMDNSEDRKKVDSILASTFAQKARLMGLS